MSGAAFSRATIRAHGASRLRLILSHLIQNLELTVTLRLTLQESDCQGAERAEATILLRDLRRERMKLTRQARQTIRRTAVFTSQCDFGGGGNELHPEATGEDDPKATGDGGA